MGQPSGKPRWGNQAGQPGGYSQMRPPCGEARWGNQVGQPGGATRRGQVGPPGGEGPRWGNQVGQPGADELTSHSVVCMHSISMFCAEIPYMSHMVKASRSH